MFPRGGVSALSEPNIQLTIACTSVRVCETTVHNTSQPLKDSRDRRCSSIMLPAETQYASLHVRQRAAGSA